MTHIFTPNKLARDRKGTQPNDGAFHSFSVKPYQPKDVGIKIGKAGRRMIISDKRDEDISAREKYRNNFDRIFGKR